MSWSAARPLATDAIWTFGVRAVGIGVQACMVIAKPITAPEEAVLIITIIIYNIVTSSLIIRSDGVPFS